MINRNSKCESKLFIFLFLLLNLSQAFAVVLNESKALELLVKKNLEIIANKYQIEFSKADELTAGLWANPSILIDSQLNSFGEGWNQTSAGGPAQRDLVLSVPIDINGKRSQAAKVQKFATKVNELQFQSEVRNKMLELLSNLYSLLKVHKEVELVVEKKELLDKLVLALEKRIGVSNSQPLIQSRAKLALENSKMDLENKKTEQQILENLIRTTLFLVQTEDIILGLDFSQTYEEFDEIALIKKGQEQSPEAIAFKILKSRSEADIDLQHKLRFDDISIQAGLTRQEMLGANPHIKTSQSLGNAWSWLIGVTIPIPIFDRNQGNIMKANLLKNQVEVQEQFYILKLKENIHSSLQRIQLISSNLKRYKSTQLENARIVRDSALRQFGSGSSSLNMFLPNTI